MIHTNRLEEIQRIKSKIKENVAVNDDIICDLCDQLITMASGVGDYQSVAFGYVWRADYFFYVASDMANTAQALDWAQQYIDEKTATPLLEKYYTLRHVIHEVSFDIRAAFHDCLKALAVAEELNMAERIGANYGNLGTYFLEYDCFEEALLYTSRAMDVLRKLPEAKPRVLRLLLSNLIQIDAKLNRLEKAREAIEELSALPVEAKDLKVYVDQGYLTYYSMRGDRAQSLHYLEELLGGELMQIPNRAFVIEMLTCALEAMMRLAESQRAGEILATLWGLMNKNEPEPRLALLKLEIQYTRRFGTPQALRRCYRDYYALFLMVQNSRAQVRTDGMRARIALDEATAKSNVSQSAIMELHALAHIDELTKVYNRRYFNLKLDELANCNETASIGFLMIDIDYFKEYNDGYGHLAGDQTLRSVASCLRSQQTEQMAVFRYGGDEFVCLSWGLDAQALDTYAKRVSSALAEENILHEYSRCAKRVTLSIGYGAGEISAKLDMMNLLDEVDKALYEAKYSGRNNMKGVAEKREAERRDHAQI